MGRKKRRKNNPNHSHPTRHSDPVRLPPESPGSAPSPQRVTTVQAAVFSGPLPPPEILKQYDEISPGLADRIVSLTENQSRHRQELEKTVIRTRSRNETLGQIFAFILSLGVMGGSIWLISLGKSVEGLSA